MIPLTRKFYNSIVYHRKSIDRSKVILQGDIECLSFIYHKASGVVEALQTTPLTISTDNMFSYGVKTFNDGIPDDIKHIIKNYKHTFGKSQLIWDNENEKLDILSLNYTVKDFDRFVKDTNTYEKDYSNVFEIEYSVSNIDGTIIDLSDYNEISVKNMGDKNKTNLLLINNSKDNIVYLDNNNPNKFTLTVNDFSEENIVRVKIKNKETQNLWLTAFISVIARK